MAQNCLEKVSMDARHEQEVRSDYNRENPYSGTHPNALGGENADAKGKGTGNGGHTFWQPNCSGELGTFNYSNFDTALASHAGNKDDNAAREQAMVRSVYGPDKPYSAKMVDTSRNVREGQYQIR